MKVRHSMLSREGPKHVAAARQRDGRRTSTTTTDHFRRERLAFRPLTGDVRAPFPWKSAVAT